MDKNWIGKTINVSSTYAETRHSSLFIQIGGEDGKVYLFKSKYGGEYYISEEVAIENIEEKLEKQDIFKLNNYLYTLVINHFGMHSFLASIDYTIRDEQIKSFEKGAEKTKREIREILGFDS